MSKNAIVIKNLSKSFLNKNGKLKVIDNISFELKKGEIVSIVGQSGCGKTTLLNIISGIEKLDKGLVEVNGKIGYVPQKPFLLPWRTALENVLLPIEIQGEVKEYHVNKAKNLLKIMGLTKFQESYPGELSGGMNQRVSLAKVLLQDPEIILFDEPFSALDFDMRLVFLQQIRNLIKKTNKSALFVTHNIEEAITIADKIVVFSPRPVKIRFEKEIFIEEKKRHPVLVKKTEQFQILFEKIWRNLREK